MHVLVTFAQSLDGRTATVTGKSQWISGPESLVLAHRLRRSHDAILVGAGTLIADNPSLTCRLREDGTVGDTTVAPTPVRFVVDPRVRIPTDAAVVRSAREVPTHIVCMDAALDAAARERVRAIESCGAVVATLPDTDGKLAPTDIIAYVESVGCAAIMIEGGSRTVTEFLRAGVVDRLVVVTAPLLIGAGIEGIGDLGIRELSAAIRPSGVSTYPVGNDIVFDMTLRNRIVREESRND